MIKRYIFLSFSSLFFSFFMILFFISSIILLISLAAVTLIIKMDFFDLFTIFMYMTPTTIFFIIPITFVTACILTISRLSFEYEMLSLFSLGFSPRKLILIFTPITIFATVVLLSFSLIVMPLTKSAYFNFLGMKKAQVDINLTAGEFGQKIGDYLVYVGKKINKNSYQNLVLFSLLGVTEQSFIVAKSGDITNDNGVFRLLLRDGNAYIAQSGIVRKIAFAQMNVANELENPTLSSFDLIKYWANAFGAKASNTYKKRFSQAIMISLFPLASLFLIPFLGIANPRFNKNLASVYIITIVVIYYGAMQFFMDTSPMYGLLFPPAYFMLGYILYRRYISSFY